MSGLVKRAREKSCAVCNSRLAVERYWPFCSGRCADVDLARWFTGRYALPSEEPVDHELAGRAGRGGGLAPAGRRWVGLDLV